MISNYIIITPAKNEARYIEKTIISVINQTVLPLRWIIVDDSSTDNTVEIISKYAKIYPFIFLTKNKSKETRNFGNKVYAIRSGFEAIKDINYDFYCNLDADVSFDPNYFEILLNKFDKNPKLGICGGKVYDLVNNIFIKQKSGHHSVAGPTQFFRYQCYIDIGGYIPSQLGLVDAVAEVSARMKGWETRTFTELKVKHYRRTSSASNSLVKIAIREGKTDYYLGYHPIWHLLRSLSRIFSSPLIIGSLLRTYSFLKCYLLQEQRFIDDEFIKHIRKEEFHQIKKYYSKIIKFY